MSRPSLRGAITALVTPFRDGKVDLERLRQQVKYQLDQGINGLVPCGTTGESPTLAVDEHKRVIETTIAEVAGRVPVVAGVGANATAEAVELHRFAKNAGATAGLSVNPYYNKPSQEGLYRHFMTLSEKVDLPIVLYNIPARTGITMSPQTVARLYADGNIAAVKEATGDANFASLIMQECDVPVLSGDDPLTLPIMSVGGVGVISVLSNVLPARVAELCRVALAGDFSAARAIHHEVYALTKSLFLDGNPAGAKAAMQMLGRDGGEMRLPLVDASEPTRQAIAAALNKLGLL
jgi:4-hydroxy-tetrahydrodipicolinate synthase